MFSQTLPILLLTPLGRFFKASWVVYRSWITESSRKISVCGPKVMEGRPCLSTVTMQGIFSDLGTPVAKPLWPSGEFPSPLLEHMA